METTYTVTWGQIIYNEMFNLLSCVSMALNIVNIVLIRKCFLGGKLKFSKKVIYRALSIVPLFLLLFLVSSAITLIDNGWDFSKPLVIETTIPAWSYITKISVFLVVFFTSFALHEKHRFLHSIKLFLAVVFIEFHFQSFIMYSMAYVSNDKVSVIISMSNMGFGDATVYKYLTGYFVIIFLIFLLMYYGFYKRRQYIFISWRYRIIFIIWALVIGILPVIPITQENESDMYRLMGYGIGVMIPILILGVPIFILVFVSRRFAFEKNQLQEGYINSELEYINQYKKSQNETRAFRHDIVNNLSLLSMLIEGGKTDEAKEHLDTLLGEIKALSPKYSTGDEMLDCIITMKSSVMEEKGIAFQLEGVADGGLNMKPVELCSLFANALDNAIDACDKLPEGTKRRISFIIKRTKTFFNIRIENTTNTVEKGLAERLFENGERFTTKENKNIHGYGVGNMKNIVDSYDGMIKAESSDNLFILTINIPRT